MARLTWQNIEAPDLGKAADILSSAARMVGEGASGIGGAARQFRQDQMDRRSAAALPILAGIQGAGDVPGALAQIGSVLRPEDMNEETRTPYLGLMGQGLGFDATRTATAATRNADNRAQTNAERTWKMEDQEAALAGSLLARKEGGYRGDGSGNMTLDIIKEHEGFRDTPYWDVNALRTGYGSDTVTLADGTVQRVTEGTRVSQADADRDLERRVNTEFMPRAAKAVGEELFASLPENQKAALTSITYNYGELPSSVAKAVQSGDPTAVANAISALGTHNDGVNAKRRNQEANLYLGDGGSFGVGVADLVPENNLLGMDFWDTQSDDYRNQETEGYDERRRRKDLEYEDAATAAAKDLAESVKATATLPQDQAALIGESDASIDVRNRALELLKTEGAQSEYAVPFGTPSPNLRDAGGAGITLEVAEGSVNEVLKNDPQLRVQSNASSFGSEPTVVIAEKLGLATEDGKGWWVSKTDQLIEDAKAKGISLTPGEASSLLLESAGYAELFMSGVLPFGEQWGDTYADTSKALTLAEQYMTPEQKRAGAEKSAKFGQAQEALGQLKEDMGTIAQGMTQAERKGDKKEIARFEKMWESKLNELNTFEERMGLAPEKVDPPKDNASGNGGGATTTPTTTAPDPIQLAAEKAADTAIQTATNGTVDLATLTRQPPDVQVQLLDQAIRKLSAEGGPPAQIQILEDLRESAFMEAKAPEQAALASQVKSDVGQGLGSVMSGPLGQAAIKVADSALLAGSGGKVDFARLRRAPPDAQARVLTQFIEELKVGGGSSAQIEVLENLLSQAMSGGISDQ